MRGPYHRDLYDTTQPVESWWAATAAAPPARPALEGDATTDVAIIGGGYAGLSCAQALALRGIGALVLDAAEIGWGASGRNGGIVGLASDKLSMPQRIARFGEAETGAYIASQVEGAARLRAFCAAHGVETQGDAEVIVAPHRRAFEALAGACAGLRWGVQGTLLDRDAYAERGFASPLQHGALIVRPGFGVHPLQLVQALASATERAGARICPNSEVVAWRRDGAGHRLETPRGTVRARSVVLATNGFTPDDLHPVFRARAMPVLSMIGVTRPLTASEIAAHRWVEASPLATPARMLCYFRLLPQNRLLFGMRGDLGGSAASAPRWQARLAAHLGRMFPAWRDVGTTHFWRGPICATRALVPAVGRLADDPSVLHAFGWHGSGVNGAQVAGRLLALVIAGAPEASIPAPYRGLPPRIPLPGLRRLWLGATLAGYRFRDALDAR